MLANPFDEQIQDGTLSFMKWLGAGSVLCRQTVHPWPPVTGLVRLLGKIKVGANSPRSIHYAPLPRSRLVCRPSRSISSCGALSRSYIRSAVLVSVRHSLSPDLSRYALYLSALHVVGCRFPSAHPVVNLSEIDFALRMLLANGVLERILLVA